VLEGRIVDGWLWDFSDHQIEDIGESLEVANLKTVGVPAWTVDEGTISTNRIR